MPRKKKNLILEGKAKPGDIVVKNETIKAEWTPTVFCNLEYFSERGNIPETKVIDFNHSLTENELVPIPDMYPYVFAGWWDRTYTKLYQPGDKILDGGTLYARWKNEDEVLAGDIVNEDTNIYAHWTCLEFHNLSYSNDRGTIPPSKTIEYEYTLTEEDLPILPDEGDYVFKGWWSLSKLHQYQPGEVIYSDTVLYARYRNVNEAWPGDIVNEDTNIYAHWTPTVFHTLYYRNKRGSAPPSKIIEYKYILTEDDLPVLPDEGKDKFIGWGNASLTQLYHPGDVIDKTTVLHAKWQNDDEAKPGDPINEDTILYAHWYRYQSYTITYHSQFSTPSPKQILESDVISSAYIPELHKKFWEFEGWYYDSGYQNEVKEGDFISENSDFYAKWKELHGYKIIFDTMGRTLAPTPLIIEEGHLIPKPSPDPIAKGFTFIGWFTDKKATIGWDFNIPPTSDLTLYAGWQIIPEEVPVDWTASMQQTFEYYKVDPKTWKDSERILDVISSNISRDESMDTLGSASFNCSTELEECYIRTYLVVTQDGIEHKECLGTHLVQTPEMKFNGKRNDISLDGYTSLIELKNEYIPIGYTIRKGEWQNDEFIGGQYINIVYDLLIEHMRAPVVRPLEDNTKQLYNHFVANADDTYFKYISDVLQYGEMFLNVDCYGKVSIDKVKELKSLQPMWLYNTDNSSILKPDIVDKKDLYDVPNVVEVLYTDSDRTYFARITNNDYESITSVIRRGRKVVYRETSPSIPQNMTGGNAQEYIIEYAKLLLQSLSTLKHSISYSHGYCPVRLGDCICLNYPKAGINNIKAKVVSQNIDCSTGCNVDEVAEYTEPLWTVDMKCEIYPEIE